MTDNQADDLQQHLEDAIEERERARVDLENIRGANAALRSSMDAVKQENVNLHQRLDIILRAAMGFSGDRPWGAQ